MNYRKRFLARPGHTLRLKDLDPAETGGYASAKAAAEETAHAQAIVAERQAVMYAEGKRSLLIVLQAPDAGGKDGTIRHAFTVLNPQGTVVTSFKQPTPAEAAHDFLWRVHPHVPGRGAIAIFNRSHYEDVLVTRVHHLIDKRTCKARYESIRVFEELLTDSGTQVIKFFLHISKEEQLRRFAERLQDPTRNWKISDADYTEREFWDDYTDAFEHAITATTTRDAPWYVIPANRKWFRNLAVSRIVAETMTAMAMSYPPARVDLAEIRRKFHTDLAEAGGLPTKAGKDGAREPA